MKFRSLLLPALAAFTVFAALPARADNMASIAITPATGEVTLVPRWAIGGSLAGFHYMAQDLSLGGGPTQFYSIKSTPVPLGGDISAFTVYLAGSGAATNHTDIGSKLTPNSYSALTSADPDLGFGSVQLYFIHHKTDGDYFTHLVPGSGTSSAVTDLKPMSQPGGPSTGGAKGYFGLTFAAVNLGYGSNLFYYLRTDPVTGFTKYGTLIPTLAGSSADHFDLGISGHNALAYTGTDIGFGINRLYFLRLDPITGFTILGTLNPLTGVASDIANLGSVFSTLTFVPGDVFGTNKFYTTGAVNAQWQSVSFAAVADRAISAGSFTVTPTASSTLAIALTVVHGIAGSGEASISGPVAGVFTVTPTAPGLITLQATQAGQLGSFEYNMLRQTFTATGSATLDITTQPISQTAVTGTTANFAVVASGTTALSYQWRKAGVNIGVANTSATTANLALTNVQAADVASYDVVVTNTSGSILSNSVTLTVTTAAPIITNSPLTATGMVGSGFTFTITASNTPTSFTASPLPAGLNFAPLTGIISGNPSAVGATDVLLGATNAGGTGNATLRITVAAAGAAPVITSATAAAGTVGTFFTFSITATGTPTSYAATPLPAGLSRDTSTGVISGTPSAVGATAVGLTATNAYGTDTDTLTITIAAAGVAPSITNSPLTAAGTVGAPFNFAITATGTPTSYTASPLPAGLSLVGTTGAITGNPTTVGTTAVLLGATNANGTGNATLTITVAAAGVAPIITSATTAAGTVGTPFVTYSIIATGTPTSYGASGLPAGLAVNSLTGKIAGTPTAAGVSVVTISATNGTGTDTDTLTITVAAAGVAPIITNSPLAAAGTIGTPFSFAITASGSPTSYAASPLPAGLLFNTTTGAISGTPTTAGTTATLLGATNATGTGNATLTITVAAAGVAPIITSATTAAGTINKPFVTYSIVATGSPTSYGASGLPAGLAVNSLTGKVTGTPTATGVSVVTLTATNGSGTGSATLTITVAAAGVSPIITNSPLTAAGTVGSAFSFAITASGLPTSYSASPLPAGLSIVAATGAITGTPSAIGTTSVLLGATNTTGTGNATLTITVSAAAVAPTITSPITAAGTTGLPFATYLIVATGSPTSYDAITLPAGLSVNALTGAINGTPTVAGTTYVTLGATNANGTGHTTLKIVIAAGTVAPIVTSPTGTFTGMVGTPFATYLIIATGVPTGYSALGLPAGLSVNPLTGAINGTPTAAGSFNVTVQASNSAGTGSAGLTFVIVPAPSSRIVNFSARALSGPGDQTLIMGFVVSGNGKNILVRGMGPTLADFGVVNFLSDPMLTVYGHDGSIATNDNWSIASDGQDQSALIASTSRLFGAYALPTGSKDSALLFTVNNGAHTTSMVRPNSTTGVALTEIFDIDSTAAARLVNVSARMNVSLGEGTLIAGFVIGGNAPKTLLVRGVGAALAVYGVTGVLADPQIAVYAGGTLVASDDNWESGASTTADLMTVSARVGAFPLAAGSKDAAVLVTLQPGAYTVHVTGVANTTGIALVEIYDTE